ncbi:retrovirus-related pol polyprotein from transposon TNT 1-94, partial [Tanacetum coccineum]
MQTFTLLKNDFKNEESRNINREIALEKKIKQLDNIVYKRDQSAKTEFSESSYPSLLVGHQSRGSKKKLPKSALKKTDIEETKQPSAGFDVLSKKEPRHKAITDGSLRAVEQHRLESKTFEVKMNQVLNENERLLEQVINKDIVNIIMNSSVDNASVNVHECQKCLKLETELLNKKDFIEKETYDKLFRSYTTLEKHCISLEEKDLVITALKDELRKLKGKDLADNVVTKHTIAPEMLKVDVEPIAPKLLNNRTAHSDYLRHTQEQAAILREELLIIIRQTCPSINNSSDKLVAVTPKNKDKRVRFTEPVTSSGNTNTKIASSSNLVSNKPMLSSTGVKPSTSASGSQPSGNTKKDKIQQTPSSTQKNKVEAHPRTVKSSLKNKNCVVEPKGNANVQHSKLNVNSELLCVKCMDIANIIRKRSKPDKHGHRNGSRAQEAGVFYQKELNGVESVVVSPLYGQAVVKYVLEIPARHSPLFVNVTLFDRDLSVKKASVGLTREEAKINYDPNVITTDRIIEAVKDANFGA